MFRVYYIVNDVRNFVCHNNRVTYILRACYNKMKKSDNTTEKPKAELLQRERKGR